MGLERGRVLFEERSRNTYENVLFSKRLAQAKPGERWVLVSSAMRMPRAIGVFRAQGWDVIPYPVDYRTTGDRRPIDFLEFANALDALNHGAREWAGLVAYRLMGRTNALFPAP